MTGHRSWVPLRRGALHRHSVPQQRRFVCPAASFDTPWVFCRCENRWTPELQYNDAISMPQINFAREGSWFQKDLVSVYLNMIVLLVLFIILQCNGAVGIVMCASRPGLNRYGQTRIVGISKYYRLIGSWDTDSYGYFLIIMLYYGDVRYSKASFGLSLLSKTNDND